MEWQEQAVNKKLLWAFDRGSATSFYPHSVYAKIFSDSTVKLVGGGGEFPLSDVYLEKNDCLKRCVEHYNEMLAKEGIE